MSMARNGLVHELPVGYCVESEPDFSSDHDSFKGFADEVTTKLNPHAKNRSPKKPVTVVCETVSLDSSVEVGDSETQEDNSPSTRKRRRSSSSSNENFAPRSPSASPEISYTGSPVVYKLRKVDGLYYIVKVPMSSKRETRRPQKCTDKDISILLDSDNEDLTIFDPVEQSSERKVGSLQNGRKHTESPETPKRSKKHIATSDNEKSSSRSASSRPKALQIEEVSLKLKLRRSTEQSNYKIAVDPVEEPIRRSSRRSNAATPKKCGLGDCDEDHSVHGKVQRSPRRTPNKRNVLKESVTATPGPRKSRRSSKTVNYDSDTPEIKSLHNKENESEADNNADDDIRVGRNSRSATPQMEGKKLKNSAKEKPEKDIAKLKEASIPGYLETADIVEVLDCNEERVGSRERSARKQEIGTRRMQTRKAKEVPDTRSSSRPQRRSRTVNYEYNLNSDSEDDEEISDDERIAENRGRTTRRPAATTQGTATPQKQRKVLEETTPKRTSRRTAVKKLDDPATPTRTPRRAAMENLEEAMTPKRTPRRAAMENLEEAMTPKRTSRRSAVVNLEEAMTPKRTPRKTSVQHLEEAATPKRTPKKMVKIPENEEPMTPSTATKRRMSKAVTPSIKHGNLTPSMSRRTANVGRPKTILEEARAQLHVSTVPKSLPCRDDEFNDIFRFLESKLLDRSSGCMYISGVPGTGKTATVSEAVRALKRCVDKGELDDFNFISINGMKLSEPRQAYVQILKQINGETHTWEQAHGILDKYFKKSNAKGSMTLLLVDELDLLCNKRQDVVYNLLDWPATRNAHLVVITIANTMDLPERILMSRVTSRLGLTRLTFQPYTFKQLQEIVQARLKDSDAFKSEAIQLVSRKVAAVSGDARRALDICRRATEITELKNEKIVTMAHVNEALQEMISSAKVKAIKMCSEMEKYFLRAVDAEVSRTGVEEVIFQDVYQQLTSICSFEGIKTPNVTQALSVCSRLGAYRLLLCEQTKNDSERRIILNVSSDDIHFAMRAVDVAERQAVYRENIFLPPNGMTEQSIEEQVRLLHSEGKWEGIINLGTNEEEYEGRRLLWVWPSVNDLCWIKIMMLELKLEGIVSIGCGSGLLEWIIQQYCGCKMIGVEADKSWWFSGYSPPLFLKRTIFIDDKDVDIVVPENYALLFCYFNNGRAFCDYMANYTGSVAIVIGPDEGLNRFTDPLPFDEKFPKLGWKLLKAKKLDNCKDYVTVYVR